MSEQENVDREKVHPIKASRPLTPVELAGFIFWVANSVTFFSIVIVFLSCNAISNVTHSDYISNLCLWTFFTYLAFCVCIFLPFNIIKAYKRDVFKDWN